MSIKKTVLKNIFALFGAQIITSLLTPILLIYIARKLGDEVFGKYSFILALTGIFLIISEFGIKSVAIRDVARDSSNIGEYLRNVIILKLLFSVLSILIFILFVNLMDPPRDTKLASYIFAGGLFFQSMSYAFRWVFHAMQTMEYEALQRVAERVLLLVMSVLAIMKGYGLIALSLAFLTTQIIIFILSLFFVARKIGIPQIRVSLSFCKYLIRTAVFFALCEVLWMIYFKIDIVMLAKLKGETEVGWYNAAYVIVNFLSLISMLSMQAMFPVFSNLYEKERNKLNETGEMIFRYFMLIALSLVPIIFMLSDKIITFVYGADYSHSISALKVLIVAVFFLLPGHLFGNILASSNRHKILALFNLLGVIVNILLNFILIPKLSYIGAGISTIITEALMCFLYYSAIVKFMKINSVKIILSSLPAFTAMVLVIYFTRNLPLIPVLIVAFIIYLCLSYLTGFIKKENLSLLKKTISKNLPFIGVIK